MLEENQKGISWRSKNEKACLFNYCKYPFGERLNVSAIANESRSTTAFLQVVIFLIKNKDMSVLNRSNSNDGISHVILESSLVFRSPLPQRSETTLSMASGNSTAAHKKRALITGVTGQDGSYLAELLLSKVTFICNNLP